MSKKPYDFLASDKEPLLYFEKSKIVMKDGILTALNENGIFPIPASSILILLLGFGTSITNDAAIFAAENDVQIAFCRAGINIHNIFMSNRFRNPLSIINQVMLQKDRKLEIAKKLMLIRFSLCDEKYKHHMDYIEKVDDITSLIAYEGRCAKSTYARYARDFKLNDFKREYNYNEVVWRNKNKQNQVPNGKKITLTSDLVNERLNILNNVLYNLCTSIIFACSAEPSIGFIHGYSRRGGLAFDMADLFKHKFILDLTFKPEQMDTKKLIYTLSKEVKENNVVKILIDVILAIVQDNIKELEKYIDYNNFK